MSLRDDLYSAIANHIAWKHKPKEIVKINTIADLRAHIPNTPKDLRSLKQLSEILQKLEAGVALQDIFPKDEQKKEAIAKPVKCQLTVEQICDMKENRYTYKDIAVKAGISPQRVEQIYKEFKK